MSEFEKELEKNMKLGKVAHERESLYSDFLVSKRDIERIFEDWQPPKQLVEVPQFVADWFEDSMEGTFAGVISSYAFNDIEAVKWVQGNGGIDLLCRMKLDGYTVEKEKLYYLKHIDFCKTDKDYDWFMIKFSDGALNHLRVEKGQKPATIDCRFTQSEINDMEVGSYEQIEVEP